MLIQEEPRRTACISTQVGCGMGCVFCASGLNGVVATSPPARSSNNSFGCATCTPAEGRLTNIVVMGMGEPLANLDNLLEALEVAATRTGSASALGTSRFPRWGCPRRFAGSRRLGKQYHLAVSLHAPNDLLAHAHRADQRQDRHPGHPGGGR